ncbi:FAD-binding oxidoreductase [Desulfosediminicola flagellatus]|uniref:FAD-binding oxidoreductase n=1 Tax=Desulfosediminicola flagellatus TaxID=2569541 RepID=UPI0010AD75FB|nr:FAD-binding oxidoreductase [Desulfosediminicola flagellatus]
MYKHYQSWGRYPNTKQTVKQLNWRTEPLPIPADSNSTWLPFGNGRSYGDVCLNNEGWLLDTRQLNRFIAFDRNTGILRCESGVLLDNILTLTVPHGWFPPVVPGTRFVTLGGAIANDIHGKNHHSAGTFGCHVRCLELLLSDGRRLRCSRTDNEELFNATIGGLGLTGLILWAEISMKQINNPVMDVETIRFGTFNDFFEISEESDLQDEYTVAWIDSMASGRNFGRGHFIRGNHSTHYIKQIHAPRLRMSVPFVPPVSVVNRTTARIFNSIYYRKQRRVRSTELVHYEPFFFPLDAIYHWNRLYGPHGFLQYQCVFPHDSEGRNALEEILRKGTQMGLVSFLGVLKVFGKQKSPGLLSFPRPGITLALDICIQDNNTFQMLSDFDTIVQSVGGAVYPGKDARMSGSAFRNYFPQFQELERFRDPKFSSSFWRRTTAE